MPNVLILACNNCVRKNKKMRLIHFVLSVLLIMLLGSCGVTEGQISGKIIPGAYQLNDIDTILYGKRIGVVANMESKVNEKHLIDTLLLKNINVVSVFTPEHGFELGAEAGEHIGDGEYRNSGIQIISLYGNSRKPKEQSLHELDVMLFDLQDVGVRFYTYISTLHYVMQACAEQSIPLIVLDRPNPNAHYIDGPVLDTNYRSFVGMHKVPVVYGMTIGEYAKMINGEGWIGDNLKCDLTVLPVQNYDHTKEYHLNIKPSPNLPNMQSIYLYPSTCFFEGTVMSEGRGTINPFQVYGHPDYPEKNYSFTPKSIKGASINPKFKDQVCYGVLLDTVKAYRNSLDNGLDLNYLIEAYNKMALGEEFFIDYFNLLAGNSVLKEQILNGMKSDQIKQTWEKDLKEFKETRAKYLLYP